jgi:NAD(P)-dependent dehydrogenase (short-subunit alcohol dehydrogenase family)
MNGMLAGRVAVVTRGASTIGRGVCAALGRAGASLAVGDPGPDAAALVAAELGAEGIAARGWETDPTRLGSIEELVERAVAAFGRLDVMVNVAAVPASGPAESLAPEAFVAGISSNVNAALFGCQYAARQMVRQPPADGSESRGCIVNVTSVAGVLALPGHAAFCAAMAALHAMTKSLAVEWGSLGIRVVNVAAGLDSEVLAGLLPMDGAARRVPPAALVTPADVGQAVVYVASDQAGRVNGTTIYADGGWLADGYWLEP